MEARKQSTDYQKAIVQKLTSLAHYNIDISFITADPFAEVNTPIQSQQTEHKRECNFPSYRQYLTTLRKHSTPDLFLNYLNELLELVPKKQTVYFATRSERTQIEARKLWVDVVSKTNKINAEWMLPNLPANRSNEFKLGPEVKQPVAERKLELAQVARKNEVMRRLKRLGFRDNTEKVFDACIDYLQFNTKLVVTFNARFLNNPTGLLDFQMLNFFEGRIHRTTSSYKNSRVRTEIELFDYLPDEKPLNLRNQFLKNLSARPRYGALMLLDENHTIECISNYGTSFIVLSHSIKPNCLFLPMDSMEARTHYGKKLTPCGFFHLDILLLQGTDAFVSTLAERVTKGVLPLAYKPQYKGIFGEGDFSYIEALLPAFDLMDCNVVEHIYINPNEYKITHEEREIFARRNIILTNLERNPYPLQCALFMQFLNSNSISSITESLEKFPLLLFVTNRSGMEPIHIAARRGFASLVELFLKKGANPNKLASDGKTAIHYAVESGNLDTIQVLCQYKLTNLNQKNNEGESALFIAVRNGNVKIVAFLLQIEGIDLNGARTPGDGKTILEMAIQNEAWEIFEVLQTAKLKMPHEAKKTEEEIKTIVRQEVVATKQEKFERGAFLKFKELFESEIKGYSSLSTFKNQAISNVRDILKCLEEKPINHRAEIALGCLISEIEKCIIGHENTFLKLRSQSNLVLRMQKVKENYLKFLNSQGFNIDLMSDAKLKSTYESFSHYSVLKGLFG